MIPILFTPDERDFTSNGLGRLTDCRKFEVTEERNGVYEAYFEYPVDGPLFEELKYGYFVYATHDESKTPQAFEIYSKEADMSGWASFRAWHISYQLNDVIVKPCCSEGARGASWTFTVRVTMSSTCTRSSCTRTVGATGACR